MEQNLVISQSENLQAGFIRRAMATAIDYMLTSGIYLFIFFLFINDYSIFTPYYLSSFFLTYLYSAILNFTWQKTIGKALLKIKVIGKGERLSFKEAFLRQIYIFVLLIMKPAIFLFWLDCLWMLWDKKKQTIHDKLAGTYVVLAKPKGNNL